MDGNLAACQPYDLFTASDRVIACANYLDTRGYVHYRRREMEAALVDLHLAVQAKQRAVQAMPWQIEFGKHYVSDIRPTIKRQQEMKRSLAVIIYHRSLVLQALAGRRRRKRTGSASANWGMSPTNSCFEAWDRLCACRAGTTETPASRRLSDLFGLRTIRL